MKKLLSIALMILTVSVMSSCNNDNEGDKPTDFTQVAGDYNDQTLELTVGGVEVALADGQKVTLAGTNNESMTLTLPVGVLPGQGAVVFSDLMFTETKAMIDCSFTGENSNDLRTISVSGQLVGGKLSVALSQKMKHALVGTWEISLTSGLVMHAVLENETGKVNFGDGEMATADFAGLLEFLGNSMIPAYLSNVTFKEDGNVVADYSAAGDGESFVESPLGAMQAYVKDGKVYLVPNMGMLMESAAMQNRKITKAGLEDLLPLLTNGIPLDYTIVGDKMTVKLTREILAPYLPALQEVMGIFAGSLPAELQGMLGQIFTILNESTRFEVSLDLVKVVE